MRIVIAGGHGKIALILERMLSARGDSVAGLIRNPAQIADLEAAGAEALVVDLEKSSVDEVARHVRGADAVVFAAGAGPGSGAARKETVDRDAAILFADAALDAGVTRYLLVSAIGADRHADDTASEPVFAAYLRAKGAADEAIQDRKALDATIVRPGHLTDEAGTGRVTAADATGYGNIPRADVAAMLVALLDVQETAGHTFELIGGDTPIPDAVAALVR
jgi:uncharacterized protein YbjT (DUF2867 family)